MGNRNLCYASIAALETVGGNLEYSNNGEFTERCSSGDIPFDIEFPDMRTVNGNVIVENNPLVRYLTLSALRTVGDEMLVNNNFGEPQVGDEWGEIVFGFYNEDDIQSVTITNNL